MSFSKTADGGGGSGLLVIESVLQADNTAARPRKIEWRKRIVIEAIGIGEKRTSNLGLCANSCYRPRRNQRVVARPTHACHVRFRRTYGRIRAISCRVSEAARRADAMMYPASSRSDASVLDSRSVWAAVRMTVSRSLNSWTKLAASLPIA